MNCLNPFRLKNYHNHHIYQCDESQEWKNNFKPSLTYSAYLVVSHKSEGLIWEKYTEISILATTADIHLDVWKKFLQLIK